MSTLASRDHPLPDASHLAADEDDQGERATHCQHPLEVAPEAEDGGFEAVVQGDDLAPAVERAPVPTIPAVAGDGRRLHDFVVAEVGLDLDEGGMSGAAL